ncbi:hypothetical protein ACFL2P_03575, partial [Candidatus Moduliflexota bacterium]
ASLHLRAPVQSVSKYPIEFIPGFYCNTAGRWLIYTLHPRDFSFPLGAVFYPFIFKKNIH